MTFSQRRFNLVTDEESLAIYSTKTIVYDVVEFGIIQINKGHLITFHKSKVDETSLLPISNFLVCGAVEFSVRLERANEIKKIKQKYSIEMNKLAFFKRSTNFTIPLIIHNYQICVNASTFIFLLPNRVQERCPVCFQE